VFGTKTLRRSMSVLAAAAVLAVPLGMAPANAEPDYPPRFYKISANAYTAQIGDTIKLTAQTYRSGSAVAVDVSVDGSSVGTSDAKANSRGVATTSVTFTVVGVNRVTMSGTSDTGEDLSLAADITVTAESDDVVPVSDGGNDDGSGSGSGDEADSNAGGGVPFLGGGLPRTGGEIAGTVLVAAALLGAGFLLVIATRRRRSSH
jgi:LPXTG-motif cell wall-anchored protein